MNEIIKVKNKDYGEYEELLFRRDNLKKEAYLFQMEYIRIFGDLITDVFKMKVSCIRKKKTISFCQTAINKGNAIDQDAMNSWIESEMKDYNERLQKMIEDNEAAHNSETISKGELAKIKHLYHKLAKLLHPDINPKTDEVPELKRLWHMIVVSYQANSLKDLEDAEILVKRALETNNLMEMEIEIPGLSEKINVVREEIYKIKETAPYQYKYLLADDEAVREKKESLQAELKEYIEYERKLDEVLNGLLTSGVSFIWRMN
ncbi:MAG: hypothetical protein LUF00_09145 [Lachnospiraceae bacterium]|nr:hypothetical protein [Lachnospiraceae bacterium]